VTQLRSSRTIGRPLSSHLLMRVWVKSTIRPKSSTRWSPMTRLFHRGLPPLSRNPHRGAAHRRCSTRSSCAFCTPAV